MTYHYLYMRQSTSVFLAKHMMTRLFEGKIIVITEFPKNLYAPFRRQWKKQLVSKQRELSMTLDLHQKNIIQNEIDQMNRLRFTYEVRADDDSDVIFANPTEAIPYLPECQTLYVAQELFLTNFDYYAQIIHSTACIFSLAKIQKNAAVAAQTWNHSIV